MPYAVTDTISVPADCSAGVALAGLSYFAVWPQTLRDVSRRGVLLHNSGRSGVQLNIYPWTHGTSGSVVTAFERTNSNCQFQSYPKLTTERTDDEIWVVLV